MRRVEDDQGIGPQNTYDRSKLGTDDGQRSIAPRTNVQTGMTRAPLVDRYGDLANSFLKLFRATATGALCPLGVLSSRRNMVATC